MHSWDCQNDPGLEVGRNQRLLCVQPFCQLQVSVLSPLASAEGQEPRLEWSREQACNQSIAPSWQREVDKVGLCLEEVTFC